MNQGATEYELVQSFEARKFLSRWSNQFGWTAILVSIIIPLLGIYLSFVSISFETKRRSGFHPFPYLSLAFTAFMQIAHMYLVLKLITAI